MKYEKELLSQLGKCEINEVTIGFFSIAMSTIDSMKEFQIGYSIDENGISLVTNDEGSWKNTWIVIAIDGCCGDPIFVDYSKKELPVYTAMHGEGNWEPEMLSPKMTCFIKILNYLKTISKGKENPVEMEKNPFTENEVDSHIKAITKLNENYESYFWNMVFE